MNENIQTALMLFAVGMTTVLFVISLIIVLGKILISLVNRFSPLPISTKARNTPPQFSLQNQSADRFSNVPAHHVVAINAAISHISKGQKRVVGITKK